MTTFATLLAEIAAGGTPWKKSVRVVSTTNLTLQGLQTVDSVVLAEGDRVLVSGQTDARQNGIYTASANKWTRAADMDRDSYAVLGTTVRAMEGTSFRGPWYLSSPASGSIRVGASELTFGAVMDSGTEGFSTLLTVDSNAVQVATADALGEVTIALATTGHVAGATKTIFIPADTVVDATDLAYPSDLDDGSFDVFDPTLDYVIVVTCVDDTDPGQFAASGYSRPARTTAVPTIVSAEIQSGDLDKLIVTFSAPMLVPSLTGCSLTGTTATLASIFAVNADKTVWTFDLSADITAGDPDIVLVLGASHEWRALNGPLIAAGSTAVTTEYQWTSLTGLTFYFDPPTHCNVVTDGGAVTAINTTDGSGADFTGTATYRTTGLDGKPCIEGNGSSDVMTSATLISALMSDSAGYLALVCIVDTISTNDATTPSNNVMVAYTNGGGADHGFFFRSGGGTPKAIASIYATDGSGVSKTEQDISTGAPMLLELWHDAGTLYLSVNGGTATSIAAGNLLDHSAVLRLLRGPGGGAYFDGKLGKAFACSAVPGTTERAAFIAGIKAYYPSIP